MKRVFLSLTVIFFAATVAFISLFCAFGGSALLAIAISFGTTLYHLVMRLIVGYSVKAVMRGKADATRAWFRPKKFEKKLYGVLGVRKWKGNIPTFSPESFDLEKRTLCELAGESCQAEIVHEIIMLLSFLPLIAINWFGEPLVFILTSVASALLDSIFVIVQRYNRPRILRLMQRRERAARKK